MYYHIEYGKNGPEDELQCKDLTFYTDEVVVTKGLVSSNKDSIYYFSLYTNPNEYKINYVDVTKASALKHLGKIIGIDREERAYRSVTHAQVEKAINGAIAFTIEKHIKRHHQSHHRIGDLPWAIAENAHQCPLEKWSPIGLARPFCMCGFAHAWSLPRRYSQN